MDDAEDHNALVEQCSEMALMILQAIQVNGITSIVFI